MPSMKLSELLEKPISSKDVLISGLTLDSRQVQTGDLFFACQGTSMDGRLFINEALQKGARAVLVDGPDAFSLNEGVPIISIPHLPHQISAIAARFYHHPAQSMEIIGVT